MDLLLDPNTHDLDVTGYDLKHATGTDLIRQRLKQRLWLFLGEWYLAIDDGVPYFDEILIKSPSRARIESIFKATILETEGVDELVAFSVDYDAARRTLLLNFEVLTSVSDDPLKMSVESPL